MIHLKDNIMSNVSYGASFYIPPASSGKPSLEEAPDMSDMGDRYQGGGSEGEGGGWGSDDSGSAGTSWSGDSTDPGSC